MSHHTFSPAHEPEESGFTARTILPRRLPTPRPLDPRIPSAAHDGKTDLDPTEWKPADQDGPEGTPAGGKATTGKPKLVHHPSSEAYSYLSQFHRSTPTSRRPLRSTPSLSHTPTTTASSADSMAWTPSELVMTSLGSKTDTSLASPAKTKEAELVSPTVIAISENAISDAKRSPPKSGGAASTLGGALSYEWKLNFDSKGSAVGSLKRRLDNGIVDNTTLFAM